MTLSNSAYSNTLVFSVMYKRSILDYFRVHEPTNAKKNRNESKEEEDVDYFDPERVETTSIISLSSTNSGLEQDLTCDLDINDSDCNSDVVTVSSLSLSVCDESNTVRYDTSREYNVTCQGTVGGNTTGAISVNTSSSRSESISDSSSPCSEGSHSSSPTDVAVGPHQFPVQPVGNFPLRTYGNKKRSFNSKWYKKYPWLEYSKESDSVFCFPCRFFAKGPGRVDESFVLNGYHDWKHALGRKGALQKHDDSAVHKDAVIAMTSFKQMQESNSSVADMVGAARLKHVEKNVHYIKSIAEIILLCCQQNIGLRGHRESEESVNKGNFLEILDLLARHDQTVSEKLKHAPRNALYISPDIQNSLLELMGEMVRGKISAEINKVGYFTLMADESKDCSKTEQLAIIFRYTDVDHGVIHERFLTFVQADKLNAESLTGYIKQIQI